MPPVSRVDAARLQAFVRNIQVAIGMIIAQQMLRPPHWKRLPDQLQHVAELIPSDLCAVGERTVREITAEFIVRIEAQLPIGHRLESLANLVTQIKSGNTRSAGEELAAYARALTSRLDVGELVVASDQRCALAIQIIQRRYSDPSLSVDAVADCVHLSRWYFERIFHRQTGRCFTEYLHEVRTLAARRLLQDSRVTVKEVAAATGYSSSTIMERHFKKRFGIAPRKWRRQQSASTPLPGPSLEPTLLRDPSSRIKQ